MSITKRTSSLDAYIDYIRQVVIVILTSVGAYWSVSTEDDVFLPWAILIFFGAIAYALFLPFKRATLVTDDWKDVSRIKALAVVYLGFPLFLIPSAIIFTFPYFADSLHTLQSAVSNFQFDIVVGAFSNVVLPLIIAGVFVSIFTNVLYHRVLRKSGYNINEYHDIIKYGTDRSGLLSFGFMMIIVLVVLYLAAGWAHPELNQYFQSTLIMVFILVFYGHYLVTIFPSLLNPLHRRLFELIFVISIFLTSFSIHFTIASGVISCLAILSLSTLSKRRIDTRGTPSEFIERRKQEELEKREKREESEMDRDLVTYTFYKQHTYIYYGYSMVALLWFVFALMRFVEVVDPFELLIGGFLIPGLIYYAIPRLWLMWKEPRGQLDKAIKLAGEEGD